MIDILSLSPADLDRFIHLQSRIFRQDADHASIRAFRRYYAGEHPVLLTERQREYLGAMMGDDQFIFCHNVARTVVDTLRERLSVDGFTVNGAGADQPARAVDADEDAAAAAGELAALLWRWWKKARLDSKQIALYRRAIRDAKAYVLVSWNNDEARPDFAIHRIDDGRSGVTLHRDPSDDDSVLFAVRYFYTWNPLEPGQSGIERKTVYMPGEIRKYIMRTTGWEPYQDAGDASWPLPWVDEAGEPLGVPVIEFANPGGSEIEQILGLQNGLNKSWLDVLAAADAQGFPVMAAEYPDEDDAGISSEDDDDIEGDDEFQIGPGRIIDIFGGTIKRIEAGDLGGMIELIWTLIAAISGVSRTPQYYLKPIGGSDVPSGEALKQLESGLINRAVERQLVFGQSWEDVMTMAMRVARAFGNEDLPEVEDLDIGTHWTNPGIRQDSVEAQSAQIHDSLGVPKPAVWRKLGYKPDEIASFEQQQRTQRTADVAALAATLNLQNRRNAPQTDVATADQNQGA